MNINDLRTKINGANRFKTYYFILAIFFSIICLISTSLHYTKKAEGNFLMWSSWLLSVGLLFLYSREPGSIKFDLKVLRSKRLLLYLVLAFGFFITHLWDFNNLPWSDKGLFDDGAWDIYFAKERIFTDQPFQAAFFDEVGLISREVVFHYYITFFFKLFGYNLLIFNISLTILGYITFIFTTMLAERLFKKNSVTIFTAIVMNFFPLHYMHMYAGHRYAMAAPMIMASVYFSYTGFSMKSKMRLTLGALFAALAVDSAVMGKQYLYGLIIGTVLLVIFHRKTYLKRKIVNKAIYYTMALVICMMPLIVYVIFNPVYFNHEKNMTKEFIRSLDINLEEDGAIGYVKMPFAVISKTINQDKASIEFREYIELLLGTFFNKDTGVKWFIPGFTAIPLAYYLLIIPGIIIALRRRYYTIVVLAILPAVGAFVAGSSDYRVLHGASFWVILVACALSGAYKLNDYKKLEKYKLGYVALAACVIVASLGLYSSVSYIYKMASDKNSLRLLPHKDVEVARYMKDLVAGVENPSTKMRWNELNTGLSVSSKYDTLLCQGTGYAITHLFLHDFGNKKIMAFSDQLPFQIMEVHEIFNANKKAISEYNSSSKKDLKLIWEYDNKTYGIISKFKSFEKYGKGQDITISTDSGNVKFYILDILNENIDKLKLDVANLSLE